VDEPRRIDWSTAEVEAGALSVELTGEPSRSWAEHMTGVLTRLEPGARVKVTRRRIKARGVTEDAAEALRHLLESAAQQTNSDLAPPPAPASGEEDEGDRRLTATFRGFAAAEGV
jgi:hypothetical protein